MKEELITLKTAKLAKAKEFGYESPAWYGCNDSGNKLTFRTWGFLNAERKQEDQSGTLIYQAARQDTLQKWLREKHQIFIDMFFEEEKWSGRVYKHKDPEQRWKSCSTDTYEETLEHMLQIGLDLIWLS